MKKVLIFSGTTEGRKFAELLSKHEMPCVVSVATEYGEIVMPELPYVAIHTGRMDEKETVEFLQTDSFFAIVDATHPYATVVSQNAHAAAKETGIPYFRLKRSTDMNFSDSIDWKEEKITYVSSAEECAKALEQQEGNILLTTGSKDLSVYCQEKSLRSRLFVRVLPGQESLSLCEENGIRGKQIIAMQGPFQEMLNEAIIRQFSIRCLVTKESGANGGFLEKIAAAKKTDTSVYVIQNPDREQPGESEDEIFQKIKSLANESPKETLQNEVFFVGTGMGNPDFMTIQANRVIQEADYVLGAKRLLINLKTKGEKLPYYLAADILPLLEKWSGKGFRIAILFSGDTGFYSGCASVYEKVKEREDCKAVILPGISSVSYFAARTGYSYQDAAILSIHGKKIVNMEAELLESIQKNEKTFLLTSGVSDIADIGKLLLEEGLAHCRILAGFQLSYPEEKVYDLSPETCGKLEQPGLYVCLILNGKTKEKRTTHGWSDETFIREKVPMTKEEIREISICKLRLFEKAVVYDIGSGTGSIAIEIAAQDAKTKVYAIEKKEAAVALMKKNANKFHIRNLAVVEGKAPEALAELEVPTHAFIGGTSGNLREIIDSLYQKNPKMRVVITAISLETTAELADLKKDKRIGELELVQVQVNRAKPIGDYQLMQSENPVYICSFYFKD